MKKLLSFTFTGMLIFLASTTMSIAQDFCKTDPSFNKVLVDNEYITATEVTFQPGVKTNMHTHPAAFIYVLTDGVLFIRYADGVTQTFELKAGDSAYQGPEKPHFTENTGTKPAKLLLVELKEHPFIPEGKMKK